MIFTVFIIFVLPGVSSTTREITGSNLSPDTSFFYSIETLYNIVEDYGAAGRDYYINSRFTFDVIWPIVYGFFLVSALSLTFKVTIANKNLYFINLLPLFAVVFDFLENIAVSFLMYRDPLTSHIGYLAPYFTLIKWLLIFSAFSLLVIGFIVRCFLFIRRKFFN